MKKEKILKVILLVILILVIIFLVCTVRKMLILKSLNEKVSQYIKSDNYYEKITNNIGTITEYYCKGDNAVVHLNNTYDGKTRKLSNYFKGKQCNTYIESSGDKIARLNSNGVPSKIMIINSFDTNNDLWLLFLMSARAHIKIVEYNNRECYIISIDKNNEVYIEKDTGLRVKAREGKTTNETGKEIPLEVEYYYEFNNVNDEIFIEPDISQYRIEEDT